ncbi:MAG: peptide deformylase [Candidatus Marinimicrobia bacterium]|nr:peptide deformylase [Candidatus Neomarinimicrobiota bacterium]
MSALKLRYYGDPILRRETHNIVDFDSDLERFIQDMIETMHEYGGVGLAAPQVGDVRSLIVIDVSEEEDEEPSEPIVMINPDIQELYGGCVLEEGCLSIPEVKVEVERPEEIKVKFQNKKGEKKVLQCNGILARIVQHEVDHLRGRLMIDYISSVKRDLLKTKLQKISRGEIPVGV